MVVLRLAYSARPAPAFLPVGRWLRRAWSLCWAAVMDHAALRHAVPRGPSR
jgi:hypothetical protein